MKTAETVVYKVMNIKFHTFILTLIVQVVRASASSGEIHIARKNNYMSPILNLPQESCTFYSFRDTVIIKGVDNHC